MPLLPGPGFCRGRRGHGIAADRAAVGKEGFFPHKSAGRTADSFKQPAAPGTLLRPEGDFGAAVFAKKMRDFHRPKSAIAGALTCSLFFRGLIRFGGGVFGTGGSRLCFSRTVAGRGFGRI